MLKKAHSLSLVLINLGLISCQTDPDQSQMLLELLTSFTNFAISLNGTAIPYGAADQIIPALTNFLDYTEYIPLVSLIPQSNIDQNIIKELLDERSKADTRSFGLADQQISSLFNNLDQAQCYTHFSQGVAEIYSGFTKFQKIANGEDSQGVEFANYCAVETNYSFFLDNLIALLDGSGDCDLLNALYNGDPKNNFYMGWRDFMADKAGFIVMYITMGVAMETIFNLYNASLDQNQISTINDYYIAALERVIQRVIQFDQLALQSVQSTMTQNLIQLMSDNPGLSLDVFGYNFNTFTLNAIYSQLLVTLGLTYSSSDEANFYSECWNCIHATVGDYRGIAAWLGKNSASSLSSDLNLQQYVTESSSPQDITSAIWENVGDCVSGIWIFNQSTPHSVDSAFGDRIVRYNGDVYDIYVWGVQEDCLGRPAPI
ncbi:UNKNOWN [Stylonychia lemnae]|uniref:Uncharacterized protein n=1 Tax=Stylonychia lemnae TaxID=5949 RepID=A0A078AYN8_STYLE|nr:UNKNOWN [Stylonychia lemnae]|eukprot:CDW85878.1 UNKNOWN [Stylonychia lemnae]